MLFMFAFSLDFIWFKIPVETYRSNEQHAYESSINAEEPVWVSVIAFILVFNVFYGTSGSTCYDSS